MNYQVFSYMPSPSGVTADPLPRPIRVTPSALSPLLYAILYSIEFQSPVGPRPATLRDNSAGRSSGGNGGGGNGNSGGAAAPSAVALLTSAVSAMSSFWGRPSTSTGTTSVSASQQHEQQQASSPAFGGVRGSAIAGSGASQLASLSPPRTLTLAEEAELAALQRQHEQPFVVPVIQVLHKLGGVHITVRETHNPSITTAYARAMEEVETIVSEHAQRLARLSLRSASFSSQPSGAALNTSPSATTLIPSSGSGNEASPAKEENITECYTRKSPPAASAAAGGGNNERTQSLPLPSSPTSPLRSVMRMGSPLLNMTAGPAAALPTGSRGNDNNHNSNNSVSSYGGRLDDFVPGPDEVGLMLSVRLSSKVMRWRIAYERPLAEWRFPIIRTSNERMMIRPRMQSHSLASPVASGVDGGFAAQDMREAGMDGGSAAHDFILANDAAQMHQVLEFILKTSYDTTSMETFTDFTSGELVFDAHVQERRRFV
ncbi:hypothetical protein ABL78_4483 [Leptomonas seymouri]|uniref:Uncharacterized protein n=1 Tax=Leptomonas seymouri TaxID=5684 RepID=A0A0N1HWJ1_LEPSE|nr:hypothetical protein ABL78_4483 [Leptomonas seymouri]|eukprot:KPI86452.1 hypothetical protein ABL78_4483 [Leptomonas seymouri]